MTGDYGRRRSGSNGKGEVLEEPIWVDNKFPTEATEVRNCPQQNHVNTDKDRVGRAHSQQKFEKGGFSSQTLIGKKQVQIENGDLTRSQEAFWIAQQWIFLKHFFHRY